MLFLQGGATLQFAAVPLNLAPVGSVADYVVTGNWGEKAVQEAERYVRVNVAANGKASKFTTIPDPRTWQVSSHAAYLHYTPNETVFGVEFHNVPEVSDAPLVADMSSTLLSRPDRREPVRRHLRRRAEEHRPGGSRDRHRARGLARPRAPRDARRHRLQDDGRERLDVEHAVDVVVVFRRRSCSTGSRSKAASRRWARSTSARRAKLYAAIDGSGFYKNPVDKAYRSWMNIPFTLADAALDKPFLQEAKAAGLTNLKGHRVVGGMRASLYNAMPEAGVDALIAFMADFAKRHG